MHHIFIHWLLKSVESGLDNSKGFITAEPETAAL